MEKVSSSHFPENQLGASLKGGLPARRERLRGHFPENQLGASLKGNEYQLLRRCFSNFPENQLGASLKAFGVIFLPLPVLTSPRTNSGPH